MINSEDKNAHVLSVNISSEKGTVKNSVAYGNLIENFGLEGDAHAGNWHRQISLLARESYEKMRNLGVTQLNWGIFAENITTEGIELYSLPVGTRLKIGSCLIEVTQIGKECHKGCEIYKKVGMCVMPTEGVFAKVLSGGIIKKDDSIKILQPEAVL